MSGNTLETLQMHSAFYVRPVEGCFLATFSWRVVYSPAFRGKRLCCLGKLSRSVASKMDSVSYAPVHSPPGC